MAKIITTTELIKALSGALEGLVFRLTPNGCTCVSIAPDARGRKCSEGQKDRQQHFQEAAAYARTSAEIQPIYAELAKGTLKNAYYIALSDWFEPPMIHRIEWSDERILINVSDNVMVTKVQVTILDECGQVLEKGEAIRGEGDAWEFASHSGGNILIAEAWDLAGNVTKFVV